MNLRSGKNIEGDPLRPNVTIRPTAPTNISDSEDDSTFPDLTLQYTEEIDRKVKPNIIEINTSMQNPSQGTSDQAQPAVVAPQINVPNHHHSVSLKDALKCVPEFKGEPGTFQSFVEGCEEAKVMMTQPQRQTSPNF